MVLKESLFILIKSLSKSEKRYFRLFCTRESSGKNYLRLFDAIEQQNTYDEAVIKRQFEHEKFVKQLHVTKNYLRRLILKSLRNFHENISRDAALKNALRNIEILYNKELFALCASQLKVAERIAIKYELLGGKLEVEHWQRKLLQTMQPGNYKALNKLLLEQDSTLLKMRNKWEYWQLAVATSAKVLQNKRYPVDNKALLNDAGKALSLEAKVLYYNTKYLEHLQNGDSERAEAALITLLELLESSPSRLKEEAGLYVSSINNLVSFYVFNIKYKEAVALIQKAKKMYQTWKVTSENRTLLKQIMRTYNIELEIYRTTRDFEEQLGFIEATEAFVTANKNKIPKDYLASFQFQLGSIHFMKGDLKRSLHWINQFLNSRVKGVRTELKKQMLLLNLMVHLEQRNFMVLGYYVNSTRRYLNKLRELLPYEKILLRFFIRIGKIPLLEHKQAFSNLKMQLFPADDQTVIPPDNLGYIDYKIWIDRQLKNH